MFEVGNGYCRKAQKSINKSTKFRLIRFLVIRRGAKDRESP
jgi:hypothetical protein